MRHTASRQPAHAPRNTRLFLFLSLALFCQSANATDRGSWKPIPDSVWQAMQGKSWHSGLGCPARETLALLTIPFLDFQGHIQTGELIVARTSASDILRAFANIKRSGFRIQQMKLVHTYGGNDDRSMAANNTSAFNCRKTTGSARLSEHSFGQAIDINPVQNPYVRRGKTLPPSGKAYDQPAERQPARTGVIARGGPVTRAFARIGWKWGGNWRTLKDYQHFSKNGR